MTQRPPLYLYWFAVLMIASLISCDGTGDVFPKQSKSDKKKISNEFDGTYEVTFQRTLSDEESTTIRKNAFWTSDMSISEGRSVVSINTDYQGIPLIIKGNIEVQRSGKIDGQISVERNSQQIGQVKLINTQMNASQISGEYSYQALENEVKGVIKGVRKDNGFGGASKVRQFDGVYQVDFIRDNQARATACVFVEDGTILQTLMDGVSVSGIIGNDGRGILKSTAHSEQKISAEFVLNSSGIATGNYEIEIEGGNLTGVINGKKIETGACTKKPISVPSTGFDGTYKVQFIRDGIVQGASCVSIAAGEIKQTIGSAYQIIGTVNHNGNFQIVGRPGSAADLTAEGVIDSSFRVSGNYDINQGAGLISGQKVGSCNEVTNQFAGVAFDGTYELSFFKDNQVESVACVQIHNGQINETLQGGYQISGTVDLQGKILILSPPTSALEFTAEGIIDSSGTAAGSYTISSGSGTFSGKKSETCGQNSETVGAFALCALGFQVSTNSITDFFSSVKNNLTWKNELYCRPGKTCYFLDTKRRDFSSGDACLSQCNFLGENDAEYLGCKGIVENRPK